jgi:peptidylprolyl isomerase
MISKLSRSNIVLAIATIGVAALIAGCGSSKSSSIVPGNESNTNSVPHVAGETTTPTATTPTAATPTATTPSATARTPTSGPLSKQPKVTPPSGAAPTKLVINDTIKGTGPVAAAGQTVTVNYVGVLYHGGQIFDASWQRSEPFPFMLGKGNVIPGWDQGVPGMRVGGRRELIIPASLAYGAQGQPPTIPPSAPLVFVVDLLGT